MRAALLPALIAIVAPCAFLSGCSLLGGGEKNSVSEVDRLLACIESVQAESSVSKERSHAALEQLEQLARPEFDGDAAQAYASFVEAIGASQKQADKFAESVGPMKDSAAEVFEQWTKDLDEIHSTRLRAQSRARMDETRKRYEAVVGASAAAQVSLGAFNADLHDQALFLSHDFNRDAVSAISGEVAALAEREKDLDQRLDACNAAAQRYVEAAGLHAQQVSDKHADAAPATAQSTPSGH
jgi:hypothetical protein